MTVRDHMITELDAIAQCPDEDKYLSGREETSSVHQVDPLPIIYTLILLFFLLFIMSSNVNKNWMKILEVWYLHACACVDFHASVLLCNNNSIM